MSNRKQERPQHRKLRGYAFDPSLSLLIDTVDINKIIYRVVWEEPKQDPLNEDSDTIPLQPGPIGDYLEIIDYDPTVFDSTYKSRSFRSMMLIHRNKITP